MEEEEEHLLDSYFGNKPITEAQQNERNRVKQLGAVLYGGAKQLSSDAWTAALEVLQSKIDMFSQRFQLTNKKIVPTPNFQPAAYFTYFRIFDLRQIDIRALTYTLIKAIVELSLQGCKVCTGFGHSYLKCPTYLSLFGQGHQNRFIKYGLEVAISNMNPDHEYFSQDVWQFQQKIEDYISASIQNNMQGTNEVKKQYITACSVDLNQAIIRGKKTQCYTCNGYGHATTKNPISNYNKKTRSNVTTWLACPTNANMEVKLGGHKGAVDQFYAYKKLLYKGKPNKDQFYMEKSDNEEEIAQQPQPPIRPAADKALQLKRYAINKDDDEISEDSENKDEFVEKIVQQATSSKRQHTGVTQQINTVLPRPQTTNFAFLSGTDVRKVQDHVFNALKPFDKVIESQDVEMVYEPINLQMGYQQMAQNIGVLPNNVTLDYVAALLQTISQRAGTQHAGIYIPIIFSIYAKVQDEITELKSQYDEDPNSSAFQAIDIDTKIYEKLQIHKALDQFIARYFNDDLKLEGKVEQLPQIFNVKIKKYTAKQTTPSVTVQIPSNIKPAWIGTNIGKRSYDTMEQDNQPQSVKWTQVSDNQNLSEKMKLWANIDYNEYLQWQPKIQNSSEIKSTPIQNDDTKKLEDMFDKE